MEDLDLLASAPTRSNFVVALHLTETKFLREHLLSPVLYNEAVPLEEREGGT